MVPTTALANLIAFEAPALPALNALVSRKDRILNRWPEVVATPPEKDRERLVQEVCRRLKSNMWNDTPMSLSRRPPELSSTTSGEHGLTSGSCASSTMRRCGLRPGSRSSTLLAVYVATFEPAAPHTRDLASALADASAHMGGKGRHSCVTFPSFSIQSALPTRSRRG